MYFGEVFEPEHLCPNDNGGHRQFEYKDDTRAGAKIRSEERNTDETQELCGCQSFQPKQMLRDGQKIGHSAQNPSQ
jgi:hypothetical protein